MNKRSVTHATFVLKRSYAAQPGRVFLAFADPAAKKRWFAESEGWQTSTYELDFRVAGREIYSGRPAGGPDIRYDATYQDIVPDQRIVFSYDMHMADERISVSLTTVELAQDGAGTRLTFTEQGAFLDGHDNPAQREQGTRELLEGLAAEVERSAAPA